MLSLILTVKDCAASRDFYIRHLGFSSAGPSLLGPEGEDLYTAVTRDGLTIMLDGAEPETAAAGDRVKGIALQLALPPEANIDAMYAQMQQANVPMTVEATNRHGGERMFAIVDPDGYTITIARKVVVAGTNPSAA